MNLLICHHTTSFNNGPPRVVWEMNTTFYFLKDKGDGEGLAGGSLQGGAPPWEGLGWWALGRLWRLCGPGPGDPGWAPGVLGAPRAPGPWGSQLPGVPADPGAPRSRRPPGARKALGLPDALGLCGSWEAQGPKEEDPGDVLEGHRKIQKKIRIQYSQIPKFKTNKFSKLNSFTNRKLPLLY